MPTLDERWKALGSPWRPGMLDEHTDSRCDHLCEVTHLPVLPVFFEVAEFWPGGSMACSWQPVGLHKRSRPDWTDPATLGALLGLVRERYGDPSLHLYCVDESRPPRWNWGDDGLAAPISDFPAVEWGAFATEAEALIAALEAADER